MFSTLIFTPIAYFIGCFPSGMLLAKFHNLDIASEGSGSVGATNVTRVLGKKAGAITLGLDVLKGILAVFVAKIIAGIFTYPILLILGVGAIAGHCFSLPKLKGGKGIATSLGVLLYCAPFYAFFTLIIFTATFYKTKIVSLSSIIAAGSLPIIALVHSVGRYSFLSTLIISSIVIARHHENIGRLLRKEEKPLKL